MRNATSSGNDTIVEHLLNGGIDLNVSNDDGWIALVIVARRDHVSILQMLITAGAGVDQVFRYENHRSLNRSSRSGTPL